MGNLNEPLLLLFFCVDDVILSEKEIAEIEDKLSDQFHAYGFIRNAAIQRKKKEKFNQLLVSLLTPITQNRTENVEFEDLSGDEGFTCSH